MLWKNFSASRHVLLFDCWSDVCQCYSALTACRAMLADVLLLILRQQQQQLVGTVQLLVQLVPVHVQSAVVVFSKCSLHSKRSESESRANGSWRGGEILGLPRGSFAVPLACSVL